MSFDPSDDYLIFDGIETVTYTVVTRSSSTGATVPAAGASVAGAFREQLNKRDLATGEGFLSASSGIAWNLPAPTLGAIVPKHLDRITDGASVVWLVVSATYDTLIQQWRVLCSRLDPAAGGMSA